MAYQQWHKMADLYWLDPKFDGLGIAHNGMYTRLLGYCRHFDTDGIVTADAIALCGRKVRNRDKLIADLVHAGLLVTTDGTLRFPQSYYKWDTKAHQSAGQAGFSRAHGEDKIRRSLYKTTGSSSLAPGPVRMIDGSPHKHYPGTGWVRIDGAGTEHGTAKEQGSSTATAPVPGEQQGPSAPSKDQVREDAGG